MTVSMRVTSAGEGYKYLLRTAAVGDRELSTPLTRYYVETGTLRARKRNVVLVGGAVGFPIPPRPQGACSLSLQACVYVRLTCSGHAGGRVASS